MDKEHDFQQLKARIKRLEEENQRLQTNLAEMQGFIQNIPVGVVEFDLEQRRITRHNEALRTYSEFNGKDLESLEPLNMLTPGSRAVFEDCIGKLLRGEKIPTTLEYQFHSKHNEIMWGQLVAQVIRGQGAVKKVVAVVQDITERKKMDQLLDRGEARYRNIFDNMQDCYYQTDTEGTVTWINPAASKLLGFPPEEVIGQDVASTFYTDAAARQALLDELQDKGKVSGYEVRLKRKGGSSVWVSTNSQYYTDDEGRILGVEGVFRDVTAKKHAEEELLQDRDRLEQRVAERTRELEAINAHLSEEVQKHKRTLQALNRSESKYKNMLESISDAYYEVDLTGNLTFFNSALVHGLGYEPTELMGLSYKKLTDEKTARKTRKIFETVFKTGRPATAEGHTLLKKDATVVPLELSASLIVDEHGRPKGFRGVVRDVSQRKQAEREKRELERRLQQAQKMEAIGTLAGGVAHDFNNLLMGLQGNVSLMLLDLEPSHPMHTRLRTIEKYIQDASGLTRQLLGFARRGKYEIKAADVNQLVEKTISMFARTRKELQVVTDLSEVWAVNADQGQIEQVLLNLFVNAWQAMPAGGRLEVVTQNVYLGPSFVAPHNIPPGKYVKISVTDSGCGMDAETLAKAFDPFFTTKDVHRGTGLGLSSAYGIIENHGGVIHAVSEPGMGSTFHVFLPASKGVPEPEAPKIDGVEYGTETILLVDDEEIITNAGMEILQALGYKAIVADRGEQAVEIFRELHEGIDLVILDLIMPDMNGGQVYERLKKINPGVKVLLASGYSMDGQAAAIMAEGGQAFIQKPFNLEELSQAIRTVLDQDES